MVRCLYYFRECLSSLEVFEGKLVAISHRADDVETKWILTTTGETVTYDQIKTSNPFFRTIFYINH